MSIYSCTFVTRWAGGSAPRPGRLYPRERPATHPTGGWVAPGLVWTGGKSRPHRDSIPDRPAPSPFYLYLIYLYSLFPASSPFVLVYLSVSMPFILLLSFIILTTAFVYAGSEGHMTLSAERTAFESCRSAVDQ